MKLHLTSNDGELLDSLTISADEFRRQHASPFSVLSSLWPGEDALENDDTPEED